MTMTRSLVLTALGLCLAVSAPLAAHADQPKAAQKVEWIHPVIKGYGGVHPRPGLPVQPNPKADYKVIVDVVHGSKDPTKVPGSLQRLARLRNLMGFGKVPASHVHLVAVLEGGAMAAALSNAEYRKHFHTDNPSLPLLHELTQAGVRLMVCSQALAGRGLPDSAVGPDITVTLSALSDFAIYGQRGYAYMQL